MIMPWKISIGSGGFRKLSFLIEISKVLNILEKMKNVEEGAPALRVIRAGTRLMVHRALPQHGCASSQLEAK